MGEVRVDNVELVVEHHTHNSVEIASSLLMVESHDFNVNGLSLHTALVMIEYHQTPNTSFIANPINSEGTVVNTLESVIMIAGDEKQFDYNIVNQNGYAYDLTNYPVCYVSFFEYGNPYNVLFTIQGNVISPLEGKFSINLSSSLSFLLSGVYVQQVKIIDINIKAHIIAQGKIIILPKEGSHIIGG